METVVIEVRSDYRDNMSSGLNASRQNVDRFTESVDRSRERMRQLGSQNARPTVGLIDKASSALTQINSGLRSFAGRTWRTSVKIVDYATRPLRAIKNTLFSIKGLVMAIGAGWAAKKVLKDPIGLADSYSSAKIGFSTLLGDKKGQKMMNNLDTFAKKTPFKTSNTIAQAQKLVAMGWDAKNIVKDMYTIGDAAAATGKGDEGLQRISLALSQIKSKGKLSTEELNQLAEAGISAKRYIAEGLGYGSGDSALAKMSKDLEGGKIMADQAIQAILKGMKEYKGMMNKTANETVEGLGSQIEDTFEINVFRKWGQGLQDGAKKGFGSIVKFLDANEDRLAKFGDRLKEIGKDLSNWGAEKLENTIDKLMKLTERSDFKKASLFGKVKIAWDELISKPFGAWWDSSGKAMMMEKLKDIGQGMGSGTSSILKGLLGLTDSGTVEEATSLGGSFAKGFTKGFDGKGVVDAFGKAFKNGIKALFSGNWLSRIILGYITLNITSGVLGGISTVKNFLVGSGTGGGFAGNGLIGSIGSASTASGSLVGTGMIGNMARFGSFLGSGAYSGGGLAAVGSGATIGAVLGGIGLMNAGKDLITGINADYNSDKKRYYTRSGVKAGSVGLGAAAGAAIGSVIPVVGTAAGALIGAGVGGLGSMLAGNKLADSISGITKSGEELKKINLAEHFGQIKMSASDLERQVKTVFGSENLRSAERYSNSLIDLENSAKSMREKFETIDFITFQTKNGVKWTEDMKNQYISAVKGVQSDVQDYISKRNYSENNAIDLLFGDMEMGKNLKNSNNKYYKKYTKKIQKLGQDLNDYLGKAIKDGKISEFEQEKINELVDKIGNIQTEVEKKLQEQEFNAKIQGIKFDYGVGSGKMDAGSFKNLNNVLNEELKKQIEIKKNARDELLASLASQGYSDDSAEVKAVKQQYLDESVNVTLTVTDVSIKGMEDAYGKEIQTFKDKLKNSAEVSDPLGRVITGSGRFTDDLGSNLGYQAGQLEKNAAKFIERTYGISESTQKAMGELVEAMKPQKEQLETLKAGYEQLGLDVPKEIDDALSQINYYEAMSGNVDAMYKVWADEIAKSDKKDAVLQSIKNGTSDLPKELQNAIKEACEDGMKESEAVSFKTNLKLTADESNIDTSGLDEKTKKVIDTLKDKDILKITEEGEVTIKTKDGKIDTTGLDNDTKSAIEELEKQGIIVTKDGTVTINAKKIETKDAEKKSEKKAKKDLGKGTKTDKNVDVKVKDKTKTKNAKDKSEKKAKKDLGGKTSTKKNVDVKVKDKTKTGAAKKNSDKKSKKDLGKGTKTDKKVNVNVKDNTKTATAKKNSEQKIKNDLKGPVAANTRTNVNASFGGFNGTLSRLKSTVFNKIKSGLASTNATTLVNIKARRFGGPTSNQSGEGHNANGSRVDNEMLTWVGENNNREYIIPVTAGKRQRGIDLWKQAGKDLGVMNNADGGVYGGSSIRSLLTENSGDDSVSNAETEQKPNRTGNKVEVNVGGITIEISGNGDASDIRNNKDEICNTIAEALQEAFQNLPLATT